MDDPVIIEVAERAADDDGVGRESLGRLRHFRNVRDFRRRLFHQARDVVENVLDGQPAIKRSRRISAASAGPTPVARLPTDRRRREAGCQLPTTVPCRCVARRLVAAKSLLIEGEWN
jgi:hypothetical protein